MPLSCYQRRRESCHGQGKLEEHQPHWINFNRQTKLIRFINLSGMDEANLDVGWQHLNGRMYSCMHQPVQQFAADCHRCMVALSPPVPVSSEYTPPKIGTLGAYIHVNIGTWVPIVKLCENRHLGSYIYDKYRRPCGYIYIYIYIYIYVSRVQ